MARPFGPQKPLPSQERLLELLDYNPDTGELLWRKRSPSSFSSKRREADSLRWNNLMAGKPAGQKELHKGYRRLFLDGEHHRAHRVIWKLHHGEDPVFIDHINGDGTDNRLINLRDVSHQVNAKNRKLYINNESGVNGISFHTRDKVWSARISIGRSQDVHLGNYDTKAEAVAARFAAEKVLEYHENHGKPRNPSLKGD